MDTCSLLTSYRSSPEITNLFAALAKTREGVTISSIQRPGINPVSMTRETEARPHLARLKEVIEEAQARVGITAIITPHTYIAKRYAKALGDGAPSIIESHARIPDKGVFSP